MKTWNKTKVQGLMRHKSGRYYARVFVGDKEKWIPLKTNLLSVAKARMKSDDDVNDFREAQNLREEIKSGKLSFLAARDLYKANLKHRVILKKIKPSTEEFWHTALNSIMLSWSPLAKSKDSGIKADLADCDVGDVTAEECKIWFGKFAQENSPTYSNNALHALKGVFECALDKGVIFRNPTSKLERVTVRTTKLDLPSRAQFHAIVQKVRKSGHRTAKDAGNTIEFLAYSGCRIGEARRVLWEDCNFEKGEIKVKGDPDTATKNWRVRYIPMIPAQRVLLERMKKHNPSAGGTDKVLRVTQVRGSLGPAAVAVGAPHITHHDLRHLFATTCIESGVDIPTVANWLGHLDGGALAMKIYGHLRSEHSQASAQKVSFDKPSSKKGAGRRQRRKSS
jgi:integrase